MQYTKLRGRIYWFSRRAPQPLIPEMTLRLGDVLARVGKNGYIRFSLDTADPRAAAKAARKYAHLLDEAIDRLMQVQKPPVKVPASMVQGTHTPEEIVRAADTMYMALLAGDEGKNRVAVDAAFGKRANWTEAGLSGVGVLPEIPEPDRYEWSFDDLPESSPAGDADLIRYIAPLAINHLVRITGKFPAGVDSSFLPFAHAFRQFVRAMEGRRAGDNIPTPLAPPAPAPVWTWDDAFNFYFNVDENKGLTKETRDNYGLAWRSLAKSAGCLPAELTFNEVAKWLETGLVGLAQNTRHSRFTWAGVIWHFSRTRGKFPRTTPCPFEGLRVRKSKSNDTRRWEFSHDELKVIFGAPTLQTARAVSIHAGYWLPLLALYQGARLEELTGLEVADIQDSKTAGLTIRLRENETRPRLKNDHSRRRLPLHPKLLQLGFQDYVSAAREAQVRQLFPSLASSDSFGEAYVAHVRSLISVDPKEPERILGMHCFRHNWETAKRDSLVSVDLTAARYLLGRKIEEGSAALYGSEAGLPKLLQELGRISYDIEFQPAPAVLAADLREQEAQLRRSMAAGKQRAMTKAAKSAATQGQLAPSAMVQAATE